MHPGSVIAVAAGAFVTTNVDNFLATTAQVAAAPAERVRRIVAGQLTGFAAILAASAVAARALVEVPTGWVGLLGLVPLTLGVRGLVALWRRRSDGAVPTGWPVAGGLLTAALVTVGNGGDNLAVYIPLLRSGGLSAGAVFTGVLAVLDVALCALAVLVGRHPQTLRFLERLGSWVTPVLYCTIGVVVLLRAGTLGAVA